MLEAEIEQQLRFNARLAAFLGSPVLEPVPNSQVVRFGSFEVDLRLRELRKNGIRVKLTGQPFQILAILLEHPGDLVTREQLERRLWPSDTFVDFDSGLNAAINRVREALGDSAENPRFVETLPRRGYRFIAPLIDRPTSATWPAESNVSPAETVTGPGALPVSGAKERSEGGQSASVFPAEGVGSGVRRESPVRRWAQGYAILIAAAVLLAAAFLTYHKLQSPTTSTQRALTRLTFDDGLQFGATWSPDGRFIAYSSNRGGKFDIWVQQVSGGDPVQITKTPGQNWQPDWSPDGKNIAYRSEEGEGGMFVIPALGGAGQERRIAPLGCHPRWSPDSSQILFESRCTAIHADNKADNRFSVVRLDGTPPRQVLAEFLAQYELEPTAAVWHPDGKRLSIWAWDPGESINIWTVPIAGGVAIKSEIAPVIKEELGRVAAEGGGEFSLFGISNFSWAPSGKAIYFDRAVRGARNIWKMTIDPGTLRGTTIARLTAGPGPDNEAAVSPDGKRLAFTAKSEHIRGWLFPFDASTGHISGGGQAVTSPGMTALEGNLARDGTKLAFCVVRAGKWELWEKSLVDGREAPVITDDDRRIYPLWSPDGKHLIYTREKRQLHEGQIMMWSVEKRTEEPVTASSNLIPIVYDWSSDGRELLVSQPNAESQLHEVWRLTVAAAPHAETVARKIISAPPYDIWQPHFSHDKQWIAFEATRYSPSVESTLYVMPAAGGPWIPITDGKHWDDKPQWSPDGRTIYFISGRGGFFNVWGTRFDPTKGKRVGEAFRVTAFESPSLMVPETIQPVELSLTHDRLTLTLSEVSGSIWLLDNVGP